MFCISCFPLRLTNNVCGNRPGMNNCKFKEDETTAAVYKLLGLQNPAALPAAALPAAAALPSAAAPVAPQAPVAVAEPVLDKWADEVDTKKNFLPKKGVARKLASSAKVAGGKGVDGPVKSKNINDMGLDNSGDGTTVSDKQKPKFREKVKRSRPSEGWFLSSVFEFVNILSSSLQG